MNDVFNWLPLTAVVVMGGLYFLQAQKHAHDERLKSMQLDQNVVDAQAVLVKDLDEYKKKVDALTLKAGFKL